MKRFLLFISTLLVNITISLGTTHTITYSGFTFVPDSISINEGDTLIFNLSAIHSALEVSKTTWDANGNTALAGGFHVPFGGGKLTGVPVGTHYYVCENHYFMGMKGKIVVKPAQSIIKLSSNLINDLIVYPNPITMDFHIIYSVKKKSSIDISLIDFTGSQISEFVSQEELPGTYKLNINNTCVAGVYFIRFSDGKTTEFRKILIL